MQEIVPKALRCFKVDPVLIINEIYKQAEPMWINSAVCIAAYVFTGFFLKKLLLFETNVSFWTNVALMGKF